MGRRVLPQLNGMAAACGCCAFRCCQPACRTVRCCAVIGVAGLLQSHIMLHLQLAQPASGFYRSVQDRQDAVQRVGRRETRHHNPGCAAGPLCMSLQLIGNRTWLGRSAAGWLAVAVVPQGFCSVLLKQGAVGMALHGNACIVCWQLHRLCTAAMLLCALPLRRQGAVGRHHASLGSAGR